MNSTPTDTSDGDTPTQPLHAGNQPARTGPIIYPQSFDPEELRGRIRRRWRHGPGRRSQPQTAPVPSVPFTSALLASVSGVAAGACGSAALISIMEKDAGMAAGMAAAVVAAIWAASANLRRA
jgi:hypothetical protein